MSWPSHGASQVWCPDETDVWTVFEASNVQKVPKASTQLGAPLRCFGSLF